jgi:hypothetical protein
VTAAKKPVEGTVLPPAARSAVGGLDAMSALNNVVNGVNDYLRLREEQRTKRAEIETYATVEVARIRSAESVLKDYFGQVFAERARTIDGLFDHLDKAIGQGDDAAVTAALQGIVNLAQSSPLAAMGDLGQVRKALDDPDHVWQF